MKFCAIRNVIASRPQFIGNSTNFCYKHAFASMHSIRQNCNAYSAVLMTRHSICMHQVPLDVTTLNTRIIASLSHIRVSIQGDYVHHVKTLALGLKRITNEIKKSIKFSINFLLNFCVCYNCSINA